MHLRRSCANCRQIAFLALAVSLLAGNAFATAEKVAYSFLGFSDGANPNGGLVADAAGNLYGTTVGGGTGKAGTIFELSPPATAGGAWTETVLHDFQNTDGQFPSGTLIFDKVGNLYGTTYRGGDRGIGSVFELSPPATAGGAWTETVLLGFPVGSVGANPSGKLTMDAQGNLYGTTSNGGNSRCSANGCGIVFELVAPTTSGGSWTEKVLYDFGAANDGVTPAPDLLLRNGILYGTTLRGGSFNGGTVFELVRKPGLWTETILYNFPESGGINPPQSSGPYGGLIADSAGNLYGTTFYSGNTPLCGQVGCGTIYELSPPVVAGNPWVENTLYAFTNPSDGERPYAALWRDKLGNLYGTATGGGKNAQSTQGSVFKLKPPALSGRPWTFVVLHYFRGATVGDGANPYSALTFVNGVLYGTTSNGGTIYTGVRTGGTVFSVVP
jgi:uncharacterized repeat protein (TIGR03803 family)